MWELAVGDRRRARSRRDASIGMAPWDAGPFLTIVTEAGGRFTTFEGEATVHGGSGISSNGLLHEEVMRELSG